MPETDVRPYRTPPRAEEPADNMISTRMTDVEVAELDRLRGSLTRSEYLRRRALSPVAPTES